MISALTKKHSFDMVADSQKVFRRILEAMFNPAKVVNIDEYAKKLFGTYSGFLALALTFLDNEASFYACENNTLSEDIASLTLAPRESMEAADFVFVTEPYDIGSVIPAVKCGTLADPHKNATLVIQNNGAPDCRMTLSGPGINGHMDVMATEIVKNAIAERDAQNYEYPQGIDLIFVSDDGDVLAIPRLTRVEAA